MLRFNPHAPHSFDVVSRRGFLRVGALALGGLTMGDVLRLRAETAAILPPGIKQPRQKSIIMLFLSGGPSHLDMYDLKPDAPTEYRGEFDPIRTNVPGMEICELMPMQAKIADKFTILRGCQLTHLHTANEFYSGYGWQEQPRASVPGEAKRPALGSVISRLRKSNSAIPPYVSIDNQTDWERAYYLGLEYEPFRVGVGSSKETLENMGRPQSVSAERLEGRSGLLHAVDTLRRDIDGRGSAVAIDAFQNRALDIAASAQVRDAFDLEKEPEAVRVRYGERKFANNPQAPRLLLQSRRLIEAGVSVVTSCIYGWDTHRENFKTLRAIVPPLDHALHALITDLDERGMLQDTIVLVGGEFGRTPRIGDMTPDGRSHWPEAGFLWIAGGGLQTGQVIGATDAHGERVIGAPIRSQNVLTTVYHALGIDPSLTFRDHNGRPQYVLENREPVAGLA